MVAIPVATLVAVTVAWNRRAGRVDHGSLNRSASADLGARDRWSEQQERRREQPDHCRHKRPPISFIARCAEPYAWVTSLSKAELAIARAAVLACVNADLASTCPYAWDRNARERVDA